MDINNHPIWTSASPTTKAKIHPFKKPFHLARIALAKQYAKLFPQAMFIGITGSVGKTTTATAAKLVLEQKFKVLSTAPNLDPVLNIPITILKIRPSTQKVILEMGIEYPSEMDIYLDLVRPATAIITSIGYQHSEYLGSLEDIAKEKGKLVSQLSKDGVAILNYDDLNVRKMADETKAEVIFYGLDRENCAVWADDIKIENFKTTFGINYGVERVKIEYQLLGGHQVYGALAAAALGLSQGVSLTSIKRALEKVKPQEHRLELLMGFNGSLILDDSYNGSPLSVEAAIDTLQSLPAKRRILILGETKELGTYSEAMHRKIAQKIYTEKIDLVFLGTGETRFIADELKSLGFLPEKIEENLQNPQIVAKLLKVLSKGDLCLIKGSRSLRLDEVVTRVAKSEK